MSFEDVFRNSLSVRDDSGQGQQLWLRAAGGARCASVPVSSSGFLQLYNVMHKYSNTKLPHLYILCIYSYGQQLPFHFTSKVLNTNVTRPFPITALPSELIVSQNT